MRPGGGRGQVEESLRAKPGTLNPFWRTRGVIGCFNPEGNLPRYASWASPWKWSKEWMWGNCIFVVNKYTCHVVYTLLNLYRFLYLSFTTLQESGILCIYFTHKVRLKEMADLSSNHILRADPWHRRPKPEWVFHMTQFARQTMNIGYISVMN
jgi:hypothetical protein